MKIQRNIFSNEKAFSQSNVIKNKDKVYIFKQCLEEKKEESKIPILFNDAVELFKLNQDFDLIAFLFTQVCDINKGFKEVCKKLLTAFWDKASKDINNPNGDSKKSEEIIKDIGLEKTKFYGFILFYLNTYDNKLFQELSEKLQEQMEKEKETFFFDILAHFSSTFSNDIKLNLENYMDYLMGKDFKSLDTLGFSHFKQIEDFIHVIFKKEEKLMKISGFKTIKVPKQLDYNLKNKEKFLKELDAILEFSQKEKKLIIFLSGTFWKEMTEVIDKVSKNNIYFLFKLREIFKKYFNILKELKYQKEHIFYKNAEEVDGKDEIAVILNRNIKKNIEESKEITNDEIINKIIKFDVYYREDNYINRRDLDFLDKINFDDEENEWISSFKNSKFEVILKNDIDNYITKLISKTKKFEDLGKVIKIINLDEIIKMNKMDDLFRLLKIKTYNLLKNKDLFKGEKNSKTNKLNALSSILKMFYEQTTKVENIEDIIEKLENEDKHIIFLNLLENFKDSKLLQNYIFNFYINNINNFYPKIIELFENIKNEENIKTFMKKMLDKKDDKKNGCGIISFESFFLEQESLNIYLFSELKKKINLIKNTYYYEESIKVLKDIYDSFETKKLQVKYLQRFLSFDKNNVIKRFELFDILNVPLKPEDKYKELMIKLEEAQKEIKKLKNISDALKVFHKEFYKETIKKIEEKIYKLNNDTIKEYDTKLNLMNEAELEKKVEKINKLKDCSIFSNLFEKTNGKDQEEKFELALKKLYNEFMIEKQKNKKNEKLKKEFKIIIDVLGLKEDEKIQRDWQYMESGAEEDLNSLIYFCENFKLDDDIIKEINNYNNNINDNIGDDNDKKNNENQKNLEDFLKIIYNNIKNNIDTDNNLNKLEEMGIYNHKKKGLDIQFYNLFNGQKEAIDFLLSKNNLDYYKDKIISIDDTLKSSDIDEVDNCIEYFHKLKMNCKNKDILLENIRNIDEKLLNNFRTFFRVLPKLKELDSSSDNTYNLYIEAKKYFSDARYNINLNGEEYIYIDKDPEKETYEEKPIELNKIKSIKHKINIPNEVEIKLKENQEIQERQENNSLTKTLLLLKYKEVVSNIERIEQFFFVFQTKGCSLPIEIEIIIKYPEVKYYLKKKVIQFGELSKYLLNVKNYYETTLDSNYKKEQNLRFLYGKQFDTLNKHIQKNLEINSFLRYMLNNLNDQEQPKEGSKSYSRKSYNYVDDYTYYSDDSFKIYNKYLSTIMKENGISIEDLYERMKIKSDENDEKVYKGIYLYKSETNSMEEDILKIFIKKTRNIPIAQNILIGNKETSYEEIQAFFHRAFLCRFNTLFAIEINDSLSNNQLKWMNDFINQLLKFQLDKYNKENNQKLSIKETNKYLEPLIIFVYNINKRNDKFMNEINKFNPSEYPKIKEDIFLGPNESMKISKAQQVEQKLNEIIYNNTHIYSSEICGLGKTEKIKFTIEEETKKKYIYFPLGGKLTRNIIFEKVEKILRKVENVMKTAIHLDLYETEDISILNEFLFSFCITKFYANDRNVLYIPINIEIYIEIPNCFINFIENYPILNYFHINKIDLENKEKLRLDKETKKFFNWMIPNEENDIELKPEEYIKKYIGVEKFSYHQVNIFIKLFINQYKMYNSKLIFLNEKRKVITKKCIEEFAECIKYFTLGIYARLLTKNLDEKNDNSLKKDTNTTIENESVDNNDMNNEIYQTNVKIDINLDDKNNSINISNQNKSNNNSSKILELKEKENKMDEDKIAKDYEEKRNEYINKLTEYYEKDLKDEKYEIPLIFIIKNSDKFVKVDLTSENLNKKKTHDFLSEIKYIFQLENPIKKDKNSNLISLEEIINRDNYVITSDNYRKMILISYRILADIPVILMGETGCGKTGLIRKLYQLLNNGEDMKSDVEKSDNEEDKNNSNLNMVNVDSSINDEKLIEKMDKINQKAKNKKDKDFWVLFDEINTCNSVGLLKEIFINRSYDGTKLEKNIRLIGTCNPYRVKSKKEDNCGLSHPYKNKDLAYDVNILPQSLMYFVFNFGYLETEDEEKYIESILINHFKKKLDKDLIILVKKIISKCHQYLRKHYGFSVVSLREIKRFLKLYDNLVKYYHNKDQLESDTDEENNNTKKKNNNIKDYKNELNQIKSLIVAVYLNYYIRLIDQDKRTNFEAELCSDLLNLANYYQNKQEANEIQTKEEELKNSNVNKKQEKKNLINSLDITWKPLIDDYKKCKSDNNQNFSIFFINECDFLISHIELDKGIAKNRILKENIFIQFIAIISNIPLIIIGKPGSSKSLSSQLLKNSMNGTYSTSKFFRKYPKIKSTYFQGSEVTLADDVENLFKIGKENLDKVENNKENKFISLLIFDEIGLSEFAKDNPVKVLHKNLEYDGVKDGLSFLGLSNWKLDLSKLNRVLYLSIPDLDSRFEDLKETAKCIAESIRENNIEPKLIDLLCKSYMSYKAFVKQIKEYVVYKELEIKEMKQMLDSLSEDEIMKYFNKKKREITLVEFKQKRKEIKTNIKYSWKFGSFSDVKETNKYKILYAENRSVNEEFHGNRDFYNYIKGVCNIRSLSKNYESIDPNVGKDIEKVIERNFGGEDINMDIDFDLSYNDENDNMNNIKNIIKEYSNEIPLKLPSIFLFKYIYNEELKKLKKNDNIADESDKSDNLLLEKYKLNDDNLTKFNLIECINGNINDNDARYLLLEIDEGLKYLVSQCIINQNEHKEIKNMEGSPFINDINDKNGEYKIKKISEIQNYCNKDMVLIISNLNPIYAFLYDLFNRNFTINDDKKCCRICIGNFTDQITYINNKFRIIIMVDKNYIHKQESPFLNRFEKEIVKFDELLNEQEKPLSRKIYNDLNIKEKIETLKLNYNIKNLLINCDKVSIDRLYFYYSNQNPKPNRDEIKKKIFEKIARTLPEDIIINLEDGNPIKNFYKTKNIFNFQGYINYLNELNKEKKNTFKFSIIYTFSSIISSIIIDGKSYNNSNQLISEIKRESDLIELINEKKFKNYQRNNNFFILHFYQHELNKINFIINTLKNNYPDEGIKFIFIVHIERIMDIKKKEKIYSIPDVDESVDQIFIDKLDGLDISLDQIAENGILSILTKEKLFDKYNEFFKSFKAYYNSYVDKLNFVDNYLPKMIKYLEKNKTFIDIILSKSFSLIIKKKNFGKDEKMENLESFREIVKEIFDNSYITHNTVDIVSLIINDIFIEKKLRDAMMKVIDILESNNFLSTLFALDNKKNQSFFDKEDLFFMIQEYLNSVKIEDLENKAIFDNRYLVPGFLSFYKNISDFISKNVTKKFFKNEKKLRDLLNGNIIKSKDYFHSEEARLLDIVISEIIKDESDNYKYINKVINKCPIDLVLNDYIYYFLSKNYEKKEIVKTFEEFFENESNMSTFENNEEFQKEEEIDDSVDFFNMKIIRHIIDLKYKEDTEIMKNNTNKEFNKFLIKIIWLESNKDYILTIIQLFNKVLNKIYKYKNRDIFFNQINNLLCNDKIKYITVEKRNPEHTREVNECFYIILGSLYLAITDLEKIKLYDPDNNRDITKVKEGQVKVIIDDYLECLNYIVKISQPFNNMLYLYSNELYIIINLNSIINLLKIQKNEYIDIPIIEKIITNLKESIDIIRENKFEKSKKLRENIDNLVNLISDNIPNKDKKYYSLLKNILLEEILKVRDKSYRFDIFKSYIINEKEILLNSNKIFDILFQGFVSPSKERMLTSIGNYENRKDEILLFLDKKVSDKKNEYISQILLYYFEKISHIYLDNYFKNKTDKKNENNLLEKQPLEVFNKCLALLSGLNESNSAIKNVSKLLYIGYIRVFIYKFEEYIRIKSTKLSNVKDVISAINNLKNTISKIIELFYYKVIYNKNNKDINIFSSKKKLYNLEALNNFNYFLNYKEKDENFDEEDDEKENSFINLLEEKNIIEEFPFNEYFYYSDYIDEKYLMSNDEYTKYPVLSKYLELEKGGNILNDFFIYNMALNSLNDEYSSKITREKAQKETLEEQLIYKQNKELYDKFIEIYKKYSNENDEDEDEEEENNNNNKNNLNVKLPLFNFFIMDENKLFSEKYKDIYKQFIDKHNEIVGELNNKLKNNNLQNKMTDKINIEDITKEDDIFITKNYFSLKIDLFDYSYRKVVLNNNYSEFGNFEKDLESIEEMMAEKLLKNKKLINDEIFLFKYKNEDLEFKNEDICTIFKEKYNEEKLSTNDKIIFFNYFEENKGNTNLHLKLLEEFAYLIRYCNENVDKIKEPSKTMIYELSKEIEFISNDFKEIFKEKNNLSINKLLMIYEYYQMLSFNKIKEQLKQQYQEKITDKEQKNTIENFIKNNLDNEEAINALENALRKFIICYLVQIKEKEKKIKENKNNIKIYLEIKDLWNKNFYKNNEFYQLLKKLQELGIQIKNIIPFYEKCFNKIHRNYFDDVKTELKEREEEKKRLEELRDKNDIRNFNTKDTGVGENNQKEPEEKNDEENVDDNNNQNNNNNENMNVNEDENYYIDEGENEDFNDEERLV